MVLEETCDRAGLVRWEPLKPSRERNERIQKGNYARENIGESTTGEDDLLTCALGVIHGLVRQDLCGADRGDPGARRLADSNMNNREEGKRDTVRTGKLGLKTLPLGSGRSGETMVKSSE